MFILHKREHSKVQEHTVDLSQYLVGNNDQTVHTDNTCQDGTDYNPQDNFVQAPLGEPIILEETDMLFSMDQEGTSYLASDSEFGVPIILNTQNVSTFTNSIISTENEVVEEADGHSPLQTDISEDNFMSSTPQCQGNSVSLIPLNVTHIENLPTVQSNDTNQIQELRFKCSYCNKQFPKKFYWQQHERSHTGEKPYQCVVCGRAFAQKSNVKKHMSSHKVWPGTAIRSLPPEAPIDGSIDRTYHCQFCREIFSTYKDLKGHLIVSHLALKVYKCVQSSCSMMFSELEEFLEHTRSHKRSEYRCHICAEIFNTLSDLGHHQKSHTVQKQKSTEKYYCCSICKSSFSNLEALQHHTETTTHDYACPHCDKSFLIERFLRRHLKTHATSARFACEDCGKAFKTEQYLANHKLIHSEETPFLCPNCPARFKRKDRLGRHMLIHDLTKRLKCPFRGYLGCMSEFSRSDKLKRHLLTHSNIKRFSCSHCNRNFHRAQALKHHELNKHCVKCDICSLAFKTKEQLLTHNCDQTFEIKKHSSSQRPKKASGTFKSRKPTPKRQISTKSLTESAEKKMNESEKKLNIEETSVKIRSTSVTKEIESVTQVSLKSSAMSKDKQRNVDNRSNNVNCD
ncbi:zinc finger protein 341 isoform X2 [Cephus cinctus]|nr:zinc finger protein 341 isoform X2 [Cephus cinctus]